jgi:hypothetical protein
MESGKHTLSPWTVEPEEIVSETGHYEPATILAADGFTTVATIRVGVGPEQEEANARLIAAAPDQNAEMRRYLPVLERAEADPELWERLTKGTGIATLAGYRAAIAKAEGRS